MTLGITMAGHGRDRTSHELRPAGIGLALELSVHVTAHHLNNSINADTHAPLPTRANHEEASTGAMRIALINTHRLSDRRVDGAELDT
jgi:hypothetical protein